MDNEWIMKQCVLVNNSQQSETGHRAVHNGTYRDMSQSDSQSILPSAQSAQPIYFNKNATSLWCCFKSSLPPKSRAKSSFSGSSLVDTWGFPKSLNDWLIPAAPWSGWGAAFTFGPPVFGSPWNGDLVKATMAPVLFVLSWPGPTQRPNGEKSLIVSIVSYPGYPCPSPKPSTSTGDDHVGVGAGQDQFQFSIVQVQSESWLWILNCWIRKWNKTFTN